MINGINNLLPFLTAAKPDSQAATPALPAEIDLILQKSWDHYKNMMIGPDGRPYGDRDWNDADRDNDRQEFVTYSEGAAYVLLRAAWANDRGTFDKVWGWTRNNLQRAHIRTIFTSGNRPSPMPAGKKDHLFAWKYYDSLYKSMKNKTVTTYSGVRQDPSAGYYDLDPATDADIDIAAALLSAYKKWGNEEYLREALAILKDIWDKETKVVNGERVLLGSDTQGAIDSNGKTVSGVNPSYFRWGYYKTIFAELDRSHNWHELFSASYRIAAAAADASKKEKVSSYQFVGNRLERKTVWSDPVQGNKNLPADWAALETNGQITDHPWMRQQKNLRFGGDAFRTLFWVAFQNDLDPSDQQARRYLTDRSGTKQDLGPYAFLKQELDKRGFILSGYQIDGTFPWEETLQNNGVYLSFFAKAGDQASANKLYLRIMESYSKEGFWGGDPYDYYGQNWAWMSLALLRYGAAGLWSKDSRPRPLSLPPVLEAIKNRPRLKGGFIYSPSAGSFKVTQELNIKNLVTDPTEGLNIYLEIEKRNQSAISAAAAYNANSGEARARLAGTVYPKIAEKYALLWLMNREIGVHDLGLLDKAIEYLIKTDMRDSERSKFWAAKLALTMIGELDDPKLFDRLGKPPFCFNDDCLVKGMDQKHITKEDKRNIYRKIFAYLAKELKDPLLQADNLVMQGIIDMDLEDNGYVKRFAEARERLAPLIDKKHPRHEQAAKAYRDYLRRRILDDWLTPSNDEAKFYKDKEVEKALSEEIASARLSEAQMLIMEASKARSEQDELAMLEQAGGLVQQASLDVAGIKYLAAKKMMAEVLARSGFILKSRQDQDYREKFELAKVLLEDIVKWEKDYATVVNAAQSPKYFRQIVAQARLWDAQVRAVELSEQKDGDSRRAVAAQKQELARLIAIVAPIADPARSEFRDESSMLADARSLLGKLQVRLAYTIKDLDGKDLKDRDVLAVLTEAEKHLRAAAQSGLKRTKVEACSWLAKIHTLRAEYEPTRRQELSQLASAVNDIKQALALQPQVRELKGESLSDVYATYGEVLIKQGNFKEAAQWLQKALQAYGKNYYAILNLADIRNWQENYGEALKLYGRVSGEYPRLKLRAELGRAEAALHRDRDYSPKQVEDLRRTYDRVLATEPSGSYLILRATEDLMDAYREARDKAGKPRYGEVYKLAENMLKKPCSPRLAALLYQKWAEAAEWLRDTDDRPKLSAGEIIKKARANKEVKTLLAGKESLELSYQLMEKELALRIDEKTGLFEDGKFRSRIIASEDAGLISRYISDRVEAATVAAGNSNDFDKLIGLIKSYLEGKETDLRKLAELNRQKETPNASRRLVRKLRLQLADALLWDEQYEKAEKEYQAILNEDEKKHPLPAVDNAPIRAWALFGLAEVYRYGGPVRNEKDPLDFYVEARGEARKIKGDEETKNYLLSRVYLGLAKLADMRGSLELDGKEVLPGDLLEIAGNYKNKIFCRGKKAYAPFFTELRGNDLPLGRGWKHPEVEETTTYYYNNQISKVDEYRLGLTLTEPLLFDLAGSRAELDARVRVNTDFDRKSDSLRQSYYAGVQFKPVHWLSLEADAKLGDRYLQKNGDAQFSYLRTPDLQLAAGWRAPAGLKGIQGLSAVVSAGLSFAGDNRKVNSYYGNINYNAGRDTNIAAFQGLSVAAQVNRFAFPYYGGFPERTRVSFPSFFYEAGLDRQDQLRLKLEAAGFYERAVDYSRDGKTAYPKNNLGLTVGAGAAFNAWGYFGLKLGYRFETIYQDISHDYAPAAEPWLTNHQFYGGLNFRF